MIDLAIKRSINKALAMLPMKMDTLAARVQVYAIGYQESEFEVRRQYNNGPAASFWQFERGGGIVGVITHRSSVGFAREICLSRDVEFESKAIWKAMLEDDVLGAAFARLLLWTDPRPLPSVPDRIVPTDAEASLSWQYYERNWRPGQPHPEKWHASYAKALEEVAL